MSSCLVFLLPSSTNINSNDEGHDRTAWCSYLDTTIPPHYMRQIFQALESCIQALPGLETDRICADTSFADVFCGSRAAMSLQICIRDHHDDSGEEGAPTPPSEASTIVEDLLIPPPLYAIKPKSKYQYSSTAVAVSSSCAPLHKRFPLLSADLPVGYPRREAAFDLLGRNAVGVLFLLAQHDYKQRSWHRRNTH
ncbi:hypothetical protein NA56DRAFT_699424 [Hyaloscypha hepaticicola]|uniref:Uncharacterized protein n=1 Tax=Hyaloscypha hepaticicola TaxID=2082293 RepID=A0A2J6QGY4_9HELO|nr:hypothetical protein NA56DRAFT_699424 [Hyaloscypha hepaticicola]